MSKYNWILSCLDSRCVSCACKDVRVEINGWLFYNWPVFLKPCPVVCIGWKDVSVLQENNVAFWEGQVFQLSKLNSLNRLVGSNSHVYSIKSSANLQSQISPSSTHPSQTDFCNVGHKATS